MSSKRKHFGRAYWTSTPRTKPTYPHIQLTHRTLSPMERSLTLHWHHVSRWHHRTTAAAIAPQIAAQSDHSLLFTAKEKPVFHQRLTVTIPPLAKALESVLLVATEAERAGSVELTPQRQQLYLTNKLPNWGFLFQSKRMSLRQRKTEPRKCWKANLGVAVDSAVCVLLNQSPRWEENGHQKPTSCAGRRLSQTSVVDRAR